MALRVAGISTVLPPEGMARPEAARSRGERAPWGVLGAGILGSGINCEIRVLEASHDEGVECRGGSRRMDELLLRSHWIQDLGKN